MAITSNKGRFRNVPVPDFDLMVAQPQIHFGEDRGTSELIIQIVDPGERILVLDCDQVDGSIIYNHPVRAILLLDEKDGASPRR